MTSSSSESDDYLPSRAKPQRRQSRREPRVATVNYRDASSDTSVDDGDVLEWEEGGEESTYADEIAATAAAIISGPNVERVLRHRYGDPDAVGTSTTIYNVRKNGDPNRNVETISDLSRELQFLIKWSGRSHWHNTWESEDSLKALDCKGAKKVENYKKKMMEIDQWCVFYVRCLLPNSSILRFFRRSAADKDYIEVYDCEKEMNEELLEQYKEVERIIGHREATSSGDNARAADGGDDDANHDGSASSSSSSGDGDGDRNRNDADADDADAAGEKAQTTTEYMVKWNCLPYADATWESEKLLRENYAKKIDEYKQRRTANTAPVQSQKARYLYAIEFNPRIFEILVSSKTAFRKA